ncbi:MAG: hypothetical protein EOO81_08670 [Oxalobacteraceae bacterium]|nr:MAG: hypothetical protein EOO81_08670 [Oxalobacteraceae bacterium]
MADRRASAVVTGATFAPTPTVWPARTGSLTPPVSTPSTVAPLDFSFGGAPTAPTPLWAQLLRGSSFYGRTLPLVIVGVLGLGFLSWARSQAVARDTEAASSAATTIVNPDGSTTLAQADPQGQNDFSTGPALGVTPAPNTGDGFPITNATTAPAPPSAVPDSNPANTSNGGITPPARATGGAQGTTGGGGRTNGGTPPFPVPVAPAPVPPPPAPSANNTGGGNNGSSSGSPIVLPPPQAPIGASGGNDSSRIRVGSLGTNPLNPGGSPQEGRIRITQGSLSSRPATPPRTGTVAQGNERAAAAAAANGNQDRAINGLTNAINSSGSDQGFLLQQRAMAFMDRGDNARAVEDFQAAISAYQDQIGRGDNVASAQAGLRSARSGLNLALSRR